MSLRAMSQETNRSSLEEVLLDRVKNPTAAASGLRATVSLQATDGDSWSVGFDHGRISLTYGADEGADLLVSADEATLAGIVEGSVWGIKAFVEGKLVVRRNLALSLRLAGLFDDEGSDFHAAADIDVNGLSTFYIEAGKGKPVILLHGLGATNSSMLTTLLELSRDHRVIAPDLPGFGDSHKPVRSYDAGFYARWLVGFMNELGIDRAHVIGNSMGGRVAVETALAAPERVDRLALLAPSSAFIKGRQYEQVVRFLRPELALVPLRLPRKTVVGSIKRLFHRPERLADAWYQSAADEFIRVFSSPRGRISFFSAARQIYLERPFGEAGFWDRLPELQRPALFIWGEHDWLVPAKFERHVERCLPDAPSVVLEDCGHVPQFELPDETHRLVREFIA